MYMRAAAIVTCVAMAALVVGRAGSSWAGDDAGTAQSAQLASAVLNARGPELGKLAKQVKRLPVGDIESTLAAIRTAYTEQTALVREAYAGKYLVDREAFVAAFAKWRLERTVPNLDALSEEEKRSALSKARSIAEMNARLFFQTKPEVVLHVKADGMFELTGHPFKMPKVTRGTWQINQDRLQLMPEHVRHVPISHPSYTAWAFTPKRGALLWRRPIGDVEWLLRR